MQNYLEEIQKFYKINSSEYSYRTTFENLLKTIFAENAGYIPHHEPKSDDGNKPDFIIFKKVGNDKIPFLYIEVKKVGEDLDKIEKSEQAKRYFGYKNVIISDYVNFRFYRHGEKTYEDVSLGDINKKDQNIFAKENYELIFKNLKQQIFDFPAQEKEPIKSGKALAIIMGQRASRIKINILDILNHPSDKFDDIRKIKNIIQTTLIKDIDDEKFADMYAQTLIYGLFVARYNDNTQEDFSRGEALTLLDKSNPFLHDFFLHIAGAEFPVKLKFIVDEMCEVFEYADVKQLMHEYFKKISLFGNTEYSPDPVIHFYEDFLKEYDSNKKMEMGVFYTPKPVVDFIIRGVDEILKTDFNIFKGLADDTKIKDHYKVQVLDIATGTGTFLNTIVEFVFEKYFKEKGQTASWGSYAENNLLPRLNGFELMIASYTIAHLKLAMTLQETGIKNTKQRLRIFLTNTLEEAKKSDWADHSLFMGVQESITKESHEASKIKTEYPIMCVVGNPPYSGESMNKNYTDNDVYKVEIGGKEKLKERNSKWINDDYVKFIRFAEGLIEKNGEGIVGMITAHGYIENPTFRGMRWHLRRTFDKIYILDLHGNTRKKETSLDGSKDENVFDIMTGVSIIFGIKNKKGKEKGLADIYKFDIYGRRKEKFEFLNLHNLEKINWQKLPSETDLWVLQGAGKSEYDKGFSVAKIFALNSAGVITGKDKYLIADSKDELCKSVYKLTNQDPELNLIQEEFYRIFDKKYIYYDTNFVTRPRNEVMQYLKNKKNLGLIFERSISFNGSITVLISDSMIDGHCTGGLSYIAPIYLNNIGDEKIPNLDKEIWDKINEIVGDTSPEDVLDYIYAVLHSPKYRETYKEFLKIDFPRVPYPKDKKEFDRLIKLGNKLRNLHLMTDDSVNDFITSYDVVGENLVEKVKYEDEKVYINSIQYFGKVPKVAWEFYIGGYQPAQKWLKDRKGKELSYEDINHYQKIIKILFETDKVMKEIDK